MDPSIFPFILLDNLFIVFFRDIDKIQKNYLPEKKNSEIRNRYKNLICTRATDNAIKRWKHLQIASLTDVIITNIYMNILYKYIFFILGRKRKPCQRYQMVRQSAETTRYQQIFPPWSVCEFFGRVKII